LQTKQNEWYLPAEKLAALCCAVLLQVLMAELPLLQWLTNKEVRGIGLHACCSHNSRMP
jgi:hypothetical protein